eukprot:TRINITY_DN6669_c0_g1_i6.p1 TRINITY_DN6669_c0_g1~~TRINITY_DN6669_c0_g1_i6.p1  ORF type:complete len:775 (+),score=211.33 TRINITY_DN6669_c0_g1_i6:61-2325(+)
MTDTKTELVSDIQEQIPQEELNDDDNIPLLEGEDLKLELARVLDELFSREFLINEPFLISHMDSDQYVPIRVVQELPHIKSLTTDPSLVLEAIRSASKVILDEPNKMIKSTDKLLQRNTIILRDVPENLKEEDVKSLFVSDGERFLQSIKETKSECGNTFFIRFEDEEVTLEAWEFLRDKTIQGFPVLARIKSESLRKSFYNYYPNDSYYPPSTQFHEGRGGRREYRPYDASRGRGGRYGGKRRGREGPYRGEGRGRRGGRRGGSGHSDRSEKHSNVLPMAPSHWPTLPTYSEPSENQSPGYKGDYKKYPKELFVSIVKEMKNDAPFELESESVAFLEHGLHSDLEILKAVPHNARVDWMETKRKGQREKNRTPSVTPNPHSPIRAMEPEDPAAHTVWPAVNSSLVKTPPPPKGGKKPNPQKKAAPPAAAVKPKKATQPPKAQPATEATVAPGVEEKAVKPQAAAPAPAVVSQPEKVPAPQQEKAATPAVEVQTVPAPVAQEKTSATTVQAQTKSQPAEKNPTPPKEKPKSASETPKSQERSQTPVSTKSDKQQSTPAQTTEKQPTPAQATTPAAKTTTPSAKPTQNAQPQPTQTTAPAKSTQTQPAQPTQTTTPSAKSAQTQPAQSQTTPAKSTQTQPAQSQPAQTTTPAKSTQTQPTQTTTPSAKSAQSQPAQPTQTTTPSAKSAQSQPAQPTQTTTPSAKSTQTQPAQPTQTTTPSAKSTQTQPAQSQPAQTTTPAKSTQSPIYYSCREQA